MAEKKETTEKKSEEAKEKPRESLLKKIERDPRYWFDVLYHDFGA